MARTVDIYADADEAWWVATLALLRAEIDALEAALPAGLAAQWEPSPVPRPQEDAREIRTAEKADPTAEITLDSARMGLRAQLIRSQHVTRGAIVAVRGVRRGLELALDRWEGNGA